MKQFAWSATTLNIEIDFPYETSSKIHDSVQLSEQDTLVIYWKWLCDVPSTYITVKVSTLGASTLTGNSTSIATTSKKVWEKLPAGGWTPRQIFFLASHILAPFLSRFFSHMPLSFLIPLALLHEVHVCLARTTHK